LWEVNVDETTIVGHPLDGTLADLLGWAPSAGVDERARQAARARPLGARD
jgi:hypothetical protein